MKTECPKCKSLSLEIEGLIDHVKMLQNARDRFDRKCEQLRRLMLDRDKELEVFKHNVKLLADELESENEKAIEYFIAYHDVKNDLKNALQWIDDGTDQEGRDLIVGPLRAKHFASQRIAAGTADEKPDGQAENVDVEAPPPLKSNCAETEKLMGGCPLTPCSDSSSS